MEKVLQLVFKKADGKQKVLNVTDPRENVTAEEARTAMQSIVAVSYTHLTLPTNSLV